MKGPPLPPVRFRSLPEALAAAAGSDEGLIFVDGEERERRFAWAEIRERARCAAGGLAAAGVRPGDRVAIILPTGPEFFDAFLGAQLAGAVPVPLYPPVRLGRLDEYHDLTARMVERVGARVIVTDARVLRLLGTLVARTHPRLGIRTVSEIVEAGPPLELPPDPLALIQFSSGTTVAPKPVAVEQRALMAQLAALHALMPHSTEVHQLGVLWLPLYHDMGLVGSLLGVYYPGTAVLLPPERFLRRPALWLRAISRHRATLSTAPSFAYALCAERVRDEELSGCDLSSWRVAMNGAEPVSVRAVRRFVDRFARCGLRRDAIVPVYGLSEATLALTHAPFGRPLATLGVDARRLARDGQVCPGGRELVSVGAPWPGVEIEVRGDDGAPAPTRRVGRIFARGPSVMRGYFGDPEATRAALGTGWLDTGDLGFVDGGELYVCGRAKDVVIVRGANHPPEEFEECLEGLPGVRPGCAIAVGVADGDGERLVMLVERAVGSDASLEARARAAILERTGIAPAVVVLGPGTLPRTSSGKRRRGEALRRYLAGELGPPARVTRPRLVFEAVRSAIALARSRRKVRHG